MQGIGPALPLRRDSSFGTYQLITDYASEIRQNFKNLVLTSPGERIMNTDFGVGIRNFLFESYPLAKTQIKQRLDSQVRKYMPFIVIQDVLFDSVDSKQVPLEERNILSIKIIFSVPDLNLESSIQVDTEAKN
jgi:phage baseplate assembly protein W